MERIFKRSAAFSPPPHRRCLQKFIDSRKSKNLANSTRKSIKKIPSVFCKYRCILPQPTSPQKQRKEGLHDQQCEHSKVNINEDSFIGFKSLGLLHELFNFLYQDLTFHRGFPHAWIIIPKGHHQLDPFCRRRVACASASFTALFPLVYLSGNLVLTPGDRFRTNSFTKPHFPHHQSEAVHVHLGVVDFLFGAYLWSHVQWCATICSCDLVFNGGQPQVCHFGLVRFGNL